MANGSTKLSQLIPPPDLAPPSVKHLPLEKRIEIWAALVDESDALVRAGLRAKIGPDGDLQAAYRDWYARQMTEHEQVLYAFAERLTEIEAAHGE
jgi:hypothetical protein